MTTRDDKIEPSPAHPTLKTIASLTGLSVPTVSRALSGAPDISRATRERVRHVAEEVGYVPNKAGLRLRTGRSYLVALVLSSQNEMLNFNARFINAVASSLRDTAYQLTVLPYVPDDDPLRLIRHIVETRAADAIIINQTSPLDPRVRYLMSRNFPFATHGRTKWSKQHDFCDFDNGAFATLAVETLVQRKRQVLRMLCPRPHQYFAQDMQTAAIRTAARMGVELRVLTQATSDDAPEAMLSTFRTLITEEPDVDGIIVPTSQSGLAAVNAADFNARRVGLDLDIVVKENSPFLSWLGVGALCVQEDVWTAGTALAQAALARLERPESPFLQMLEAPDVSAVAPA